MGRVMQHVTLISHTPDPEQAIALAAKLCYSEQDIEQVGQQVEQSDHAKFIEKLFLLGHLSPVEHASFTFGMEGVSRSLLAQITRHRIASFSVKSQRYVSESSELDFVLPPSIEALGDDAVRKFTSQMEIMLGWYQDWQTALGGASEKANEDARFVLPNACETKLIVTMNARELIHFFNMRCCNRAQWEIRDVAWQMLQLVLNVAPNLFKNCGPNCLNNGCTEGKMSCKKQDEVKKHHKQLLHMQTEEGKTTNAN